MTPNDPPTPAPAATRRTPKNPAAASEVDRLKRRLRPPTAPWRPKTGLPGLLFAAFVPLLLLLSGMGTFAAIDSDPASEGLQLRSLGVDTRITNGIGVTTLTAGYNNTDPENSAEANIQFPFPEQGVLTEFQLETHNATHVGIVYERSQARHTFREAADRGEHAVLLESAGEGRLALRVNVPAGETVTLTMVYAEVLPLVGWTQTHTFPLDHIADGNTLEHLDYRIELTNTHGWSDLSVEGLAFTEGPAEHGVAMFTYEATQTNPTEAVTLELRPTSDGYTSTLVVSGYDQDAAALLQVLPPTNGADALPMDLVFLVDVSGSMGAEKMGQARDAMHHILDELRDHDRFAMAKFSTDVTLYANELQEPSETNLQSAHDWIAGLNAQGATNISGSLYDAFNLLKDEGHGEGVESERLPVVILITDGMPNRWISNPAQIIESVSIWNTFDARVHTVGIGFDQNNAFLSELAHSNRGIYRAMDWEADAAEELAGFYDEIGTPVLRDLELHAPGLDAREIHPQPLRDVYAGSQVVVGALVNASGLPGDVEIQITGRTTAGEHTTTTTISAENVHVVPEAKKLWARQKAVTLERQYELGERDVREQLVVHGLSHQIGTSATSWLIVEETQLEEMNEKIQAKIDGVEKRIDELAGHEGATSRQDLQGDDVPSNPAPPAAYGSFDEVDEVDDVDDGLSGWDYPASADGEEEPTPVLPIMVLLVALGTVMAMTRRRNVR